MKEVILLRRSIRILDKEINTIQWFGSPLDKHHSFKRYKKNKTYHPLSLSKYSFEYLLNHKKVMFFEKQILKHLKLFQKNGLIDKLRKE